MDPPRLNGYRLAFVLSVPLAWAVLLMFHPVFEVDDIYETLRGQVNQWIAVHLGTLLFIGLIGSALYLLVRDLPGPMASVSRVGAGVFVLFYGAGEAILGIVAGVLVSTPTTSRRLSGAPLPRRYRPSGTPSSRLICFRSSARWGGSSGYWPPRWPSGRYAHR
jgi:hypothetical protein